MKFVLLVKLLFLFPGPHKLAEFTLFQRKKSFGYEVMDFFLLVVSLTNIRDCCPVT